MPVSNMATEQKLKDLNITHDEITRISEALKKEEFRKLFVEYAEEISDPENRARYEAEIAQMEGERGMDVTFIHPKPGYVIKTSCEGDKKAFINICENEHIEKPSSNREKDAKGKFGLNWSVPHSFSPPRDDFDNAKKKCKVYDVVFHPDTLRMAGSNQAFRNMVNSIALDGIERQFAVSLDKKNLRFPSMKFKGTAEATVVRKKLPDAPEAKPVDPTDPLSQYPYPYDERTTEEKSKEHIAEMEKKRLEQEAKEKKTTINKEIKQQDDGPTLPKYSLVYRSDMDMLNYMNSRDSTPGTRPTQIILTVELPLMKSAKHVNLDIFEKRLVLSSETPAKYHLDLDLPYPVSEDQGSAKFDKSKRTLAITLPVLPEKVVSSSEAGAGDRTLFNDESNSENKPVIEVLASGDSDNSAGDSPTSVTNDTSTELNQPPTIEIPYNLPVYDYHQDERTVTFILRVKKVDASSIKQTVSMDTGSYDIKLVSVGSGGYPVHYRFHAQFRGVCCLASDHCTVDVSEQNVVCMLTKEEPAIWHKFSAGLDENTMEEKEFLTQSNVIDNLELAVNQNDIEGSITPELEVTQFDEDGVTISVKPGRPKPPTAESTPTNTEEQSDSQVEVVHEKDPPRLHSILKQNSRTVSESSGDDLGSSLNAENSLSSSNGLGSDNTHTESDENGESKLHRSVSFSNHDDTVMYKSNASVSTIHGTLKNKRRRQKKHDQKKQHKQERRRRHNSTGSEYSSSDETLVVKNGKSSPRIPEGRKVDVSSDDAELVSERDDSVVVLGKSDSAVNGIQSPADLRISETPTKTENASESSVSPRLKASEEINKKSNEVISTSPRTSPRGQKIKEETKAAISKISKSAKTEELNSDDEEEPTQNGDTKPLIETLPDTKKKTWEEGELQLDDMNHKTQCAFEFENRVMFDLD